MFLGLKKTVLRSLSFCLVSGWLFSCAGFAFASAHAKHALLPQKKQQLKTLRGKINHLQQLLSNARDKRSTLLGELKHAEISIGQLTRKLRLSNRRLQQQRNILNTLKTKTKTVQHKLNQAKILLAQELRTAYQLGQYEYIKLLLNQESPHAVSRNLTYLSYINRARMKLIQEIHSTLAILLKNKQKISQHTQQLQEIVQTQTQQRHQLLTQQRYQQRVIRQLSSRIGTKEQKLSILISNKTALAQLINTIKQKAPLTHTYRSFAAMRHHLPWPTQGKIFDLFGKSIDNSKVEYNGIFIRAAAGKAVRAIHPGRVAFAGWLRGFGLLLIINHGKGFMTLYAHNHSLNKKRGDTVKMGDFIASIGHTGGSRKNGLYFEIRHNGKPLNPLSWCKS